MVAEIFQDKEISWLSSSLLKVFEITFYMMDGFKINLESVIYMWLT